ncbi:hypothetical protein C4K01_2927 [Pseudomonas synxantha]|nr:hypothetical protein C4K01_2927 [Pseudomonas synxantha]
MLNVDVYLERLKEEGGELRQLHHAGPTQLSRVRLNPP